MYDDFADSFAAHAEDSAFNAHYDRPAVLGLLGDVTARTVLDVGCGPGLYTAELVERSARFTPLVDWQQLGGSYFTDEMVDDTWNEGWQVRFRRAPLTTWCEEFREAGFVIERLVEPLPAPSMKERFPDTFDRLTATPFFVAFVLAKAGPATGEPPRHHPREADASPR